MVGIGLEYIGAFVLFLLNQLISSIFKKYKRKSFDQIMYDNESFTIMDSYTTGFKHRMIGILFIACIVIIVNLVT